jgi:hypothetical protein
MSKNKKVLIGSPITAVKDYKSYCLEEYLKNLSQLTYPNVEYMLLLNQEGGDHLIKEYPYLNIQRIPELDSITATCVLARNMLRDKALNEGFDYLMFIEQDIIPNYQIIEKLMTHQKGVCSALYYNEMEPLKPRHGVITLFFPMAWNFDKNLIERGDFVENLMSPEELIQGKLLQVDVCGLAAVLIHRKVLEDIPFRYSENNDQIFEEFHFGRDCFMKNIKIFVDTSLVCKHYSSRGL